LGAKEQRERFGKCAGWQEKFYIEAKEEIRDIKENLSLR
jgi:hypothetical protein